MEEFLVDDDQREAAVVHLESEHARGAFDSAELERRTTNARAARTVAELLAATADPTATSLSAPSSTGHRNRMALVAGLAVAVVLLLVVVANLL
jgi:hypothetical protein